MTTAKRNRLEPGDILEMEQAEGFSYVAYTGQHDGLGDGIWVIPRVYPARPDDLCGIFDLPGYHIFYQAQFAVTRRLVRKVGHCDNAVRPVPTTLRYLMRHDADGYVTLWDVYDRVRHNQLAELTPEQRELPIAQIWNHPLLLARIASGWTPDRLIRDNDPTASSG
jgi:hypothetical protein